MWLADALLRERNRQDDREVDPARACLDVLEFPRAFSSLLWVHPLHFETWTGTSLPEEQRRVPVGAQDVWQRPLLA